MIKYENGQEKYIGATFYEWEENFYNDSDFYALVWDEEEQVLKTLRVGSTRFAGGEHVVCDATEESKEKALAYLNSLVSKEAIRVATFKNYKNSIQFGDDVIIVGGRKVPVNTTGRVGGIYNNPYDPENHKVKLELASGEVVYTYKNNIQRVLHEADHKAIEEQMKETTVQRVCDPKTVKSFNLQGFQPVREMPKWYQN